MLSSTQGSRVALPGRHKPSLKPLATLPRHTVPAGIRMMNNGRPATVVAFQDARQQQQDGSSGLADVRPQEHWATMLTTMPNLSSETWSGRLGEYVLSSAKTADVTSSGSVLHLWKATHSVGDDSMSWQQDAAAQGGNTHTLDAPSIADEVAVRYFTAEGLSVTQPASPDAPAVGNKGPVGLIPDGSRVLWDQKALKAKPTAFTFSPTAQQLSLTLPAAPAAAQPGAKDQQQQQPLYRTMRLLPLSSSGVCVLNAALPGQWGNKLQEANPPGTYWFFEILLTHPDAAGDWQGSTLGIAYDWTDGRLHSHKYLWQKATSPLENPKDELNRVLLQPVTQPTRDSESSLQDLIHKLTHTPSLHHSITTYTYSSSSSSSSGGKQRLQRAHSSGPAPSAAVAAALQGLDVVVGPVGPVESYNSSCGAVHAWYTATQGSTPTQHPSTAAAAAAAGQKSEERLEKSEGVSGECDSRQQVLWFPQGGCWARVPAQLPSQQQEGTPAAAAAAGGGDGVIEFEVGVIYGDGEGAARCVLQFNSSGDRRINTVINEEWRKTE